MSDRGMGVIITWVWEDVQTIRPHWSEERCKESLEDIAGALQDRSIEYGWGVMEVALDDVDEETHA